MLRKKSIYTKYLFTFTQKFFPRLPSLGAHIRCAQNWYAAVQMDLRYTLAVDGFPYLITFVSVSSRFDFANAVTAPALSFGSAGLWINDGNRQLLP